MSGAEAEKLAKRLAILNERATVWDVVSDGLPVELCGDSLLIINWVRGKWRVGNNVYQKRVDKLVDKIAWLENRYHLRSSFLGRDFLKHEFRENNQRADALTHCAREGRECYTMRPVPPDLLEYHELVALRGRFDGGVDASGCGIGFFLEAAFLPHPEHCSKRLRHSAAPDSPQPAASCDGLVWRDVAEAALLLPRDSTVTDAELTALERLIGAAECVLRARRELEAPCWAFGSGRLRRSLRCPQNRKIPG